MIIMMDTERMINDDRDIYAIHFDNAQWSLYCNGKEGVTHIEVYEERGQMANVPFLAVYQGEFLWQRISAALCRIEYGPKNLNKLETCAG